jgi:flagellar basal-body rod modification protein FlgD
MTTATSTSTSTSTSADAQAIIAALNGSKGTSSSSSANSATAIQDQFLKLLTTQLQNQDPLNPMDNTQMTTQLAQISTVSGIEKLNSSLQTLLGSTSESQTLQAASLVGHAVLVPGNTMALTSGSSAYGGFDLASAADKVTVTVKNSSGTVVRTLDLGSAEAGSNVFTWDGKATDGTAAPEGTYTFAVAAVQGSDKVTTTALGAGLVSSVVRDSSGGFTLDVGTLGKVSFSDVRQVL